MGFSIGRSMATRIGALGIAGALAMGTGSALAVHENVDYPVAIHAGTCEMPGDEVAALGSVTRLPVEAPDEGDVVGAAGSQVVHGFEDEVELALTVDDLFAADHLVALFDAEGAIVACGPIGQYTYTDGEDIAFGLRPVGESPWNGVVLVDNDDDDDDLEIEVYVVNNTPPMPAGTPVATPVS